jgi:hypothetical protein
MQRLPDLKNCQPLITNLLVPDASVSPRSVLPQYSPATRGNYRGFQPSSAFLGFEPVNGSQFVLAANRYMVMKPGVGMKGVKEQVLTTPFCQHLFKEVRHGYCLKGEQQNYYALLINSKMARGHTSEKQLVSAFLSTVKMFTLHCHLIPLTI